MSLRLASLLSLAGTLSASSLAFADAAPEAAIAAPRERPNSINLSPLGLLYGSYSLNYEHLFGGTHGVLLEAGLARPSSDDAEQMGYSGLVGYRWHWSGEQDSGFLGASLAYGRGSGEVTVGEGSTASKVVVDSAVFSATANVGRRWAWDNGLNITLRGGLGYGNYDITTESMDPDARDAVKKVDDLLTAIPVAVEGELSLGYTF